MTCDPIWEWHPKAKNYGATEQLSSSLHHYINYFLLKRCIMAPIYYSYIHIHLARIEQFLSKRQISLHLLSNFSWCSKKKTKSTFDWWFSCKIRLFHWLLLSLMFMNSNVFATICCSFMLKKKMFCLF